MEEGKGGGWVPGSPGEGDPCGKGRMEPGVEVPVSSPHGCGRPGQEGEFDPVPQLQALSRPLSLGKTA